MTRIAIDIDGTLGYRDRQEYMKTCNETLKLEIAEEHLQTLSSLKTFYQLPEVQKYRERVGEAYYRKAIGWIDFHPQVLRTTRLLPGAKEGVMLLATLGKVAYYTARYSAQSEERSQAMAQATLEWLAACDLVNPTNAVFCDGLPGKLRQLAQAIAEDPGPVLLVDDQYARLLERLTDLDEEPVQLLKRSLILVAFGARTVPEGPPIPVIALP
ncbi:MAG TPA: hypothetical protein VFV38_14920, partial [Ktedonobacteraceae bacterium]|nr:hypothetical protein [Ktedonobacteraceae bacterium]